MIDSYTFLKIPFQIARLLSSHIEQLGRILTRLFEQKSCKYRVAAPKPPHIPVFLTGIIGGCSVELLSWRN